MRWTQGLHYTERTMRPLPQAETGNPVVNSVDPCRRVASLLRVRLPLIRRSKFPCRSESRRLQRVCGEPNIV
jgi:hypothetical protein